MKLKSIKSHHFPNIIAQIFFGLLGVTTGSFLNYLMISKMISGYEWIGIIWTIPLFCFMCIGGFILLVGDSVGYFKELILDEDCISGRHLFGWKISIEYQEIKKCLSGYTSPKYGPGNQALVIRTSKFPFRYVFNKKGFEEGAALNLERSIRRRIYLETYKSNNGSKRKPRI